MLVTRPEAEARATLAALAAAGHQGVPAPVLRIAPLPFIVPRQRFDAIIITSANAVRPGLPCASGTPLYVVGTRTARALARESYDAPRHIAEDAKGLVQALKAASPSPAALLYIAGRDRKSDIETLLGKIGHHITVLVTYEAIAAEAFAPAIRDDLAAGRIDAVLHFSRRSAGIFVAMMMAAGLGAPLRQMRHYCLSRDVAVPLEQAGAAGISPAARPDEAHLLALIDG
ncbi:MAG: uroporphyrinogen-III synthase [Hyphomicrobiales bacterium]|nr:uroporphyrinogen-III synthase [Hyphomicrobiales bacterium]